MQRIVVCYSVGDDCSYSCDVVKCFEYESIEAFLCDFEDALKTAIKKYKNLRDEYLKHAERRPQLSNPPKETELKRWKEWLDHQPKNDTGMFVFAGHELFIEEFTAYGSNYQSIILPEIYTIDEWFDANKGKL